jgi:signal transduction histidine kinase
VIVEFDEDRRPKSMPSSAHSQHAPLVAVEPHAPESSAWLLASIAHEISQPLTAILSDACASRRRLAAGQPDIAGISTALDAIVRDAERAGAILARIRLLASGRPAPAIPCDVCGLVRGVVPLLRHDLEQARVELALVLPAAPTVIAGDPIELQQLLANLLMNAIDACRGLPVRRRRVAIRVHGPQRGSGMLRIQVADTGVGLADPGVRLFEPFASNKPGGLGLGLAICRAIVVRHDGEIWATRNAGHGATFHVTLPSERVRARGHVVVADCHVVSG